MSTRGYVEITLSEMLHKMPGSSRANLMTGSIPTNFYCIFALFKRKNQ